MPVAFTTVKGAGLRYTGLRNEEPRITGIAKGGTHYVKNSFEKI